ncbi:MULTISPECIES: hypothetical protein [Gammaproteobacteria]|uniref:Uncharacterized protein n=1 Tax=bacterium 19NY03SH02 TaxID=2920631 RepID=A0AAU6V2E3_UNCXX|nr:hypothetical protein [Shewanella algae]MDL2196899.1 hypothetical protein [Shewanella algae]TVO90596.1 hypothetical protein AYI86_21445 [Shewanella algae]
MSLLIKRPDYIEYYPYVEEGAFPQAEIDKLEQEPALFQWTMPRAFFWKDSPLLHHLKAVGLLCGIPVGFFLFIGIVGDNGVDYELIESLFFLFMFMFSILLFFYYITRSQYYSVAYKITESGILRDEVKSYPKWRYKNEVPESFLFVLRGVALLVIPIALMVNPLLLAGAGGLALLSFYPFPKGEPEYAHYIPTFWHKKGLGGTSQLSIINICESRRIIDIYSKDLSRGAIVFCTEENFDQVKQLVIDKLPEAKVLNEPLEIY